jgi:hypothetical protein
VTRHRPLGPASDRSVPSADASIQSTEAKMRRALGLERRPSPPQGTDGHTHPRHRHRFVRDGEVPVVMVQSHADQPAAPRPDPAAGLLAEERAARERGERALAAAQATIRDLQTKLAHVTLARDEAVAALQAMTDERAAAAREAALAAPPPPAPPAVPRRRGRPPKPAAADAADAPPRRNLEKPVQWWRRGWRESLAD